MKSTRSTHKITVRIPLPENRGYISEDKTTTVYASIAYDSTHVGAGQELTVEASSIESPEAAEEALKEWADYIASKLDDEIGYGR